MKVMPLFRIHRMKDTPRQVFRWAPHTSGASSLKPKDFEPDGEVEAAGPYEVWTLLRGTDRALDIGDVLEFPSGEIRICKYVGFEEAHWVVPEPRQAPLSADLGTMPPAECLT
jgi:hypothetical protein